MSIFISLPLLYDNEIFLQVPKFSYYAVSNYGRVIRMANTPFTVKDRLLSTNSHYDDYPSVKLSQDGKTSRVTVHSLVALAFLGEPNGLEVNHKNANKRDNRLSNLEYVTRSYNTKHAYELGLIDRKGQNNTRAKLNNIQVIEIFNLRHLRFSKRGSSLVGAQYNVGRTIIRQIWDQLRWKHLTDTLLT